MNKYIILERLAGSRSKIIATEVQAPNARSALMKRNILILRHTIMDPSKCLIKGTTINLEVAPSDLEDTCKDIRHRPQAYGVERLADVEIIHVDGRVTRIV